MTPTHLGLTAAAVLGLGGLTYFAATAQPPAPKNLPPKTAAGELPGEKECVEQVIAARKAYQDKLVQLYKRYSKDGDRERAKWVEDELKGFHLADKPSYRLDILDVPPEGMQAGGNVKEANDLFREAMQYKDRGSGTEYVLNQRRAEILFQQILQEFPECDKIADVAYQLGDLYEGRAFKQYARAAKYFERAYQWKKGVTSDARLRAAKIYDRNLNERGKAIEIYRDELANDTDPARLKEAERRLAELTAGKR